MANDPTQAWRQEVDRRFKDGSDTMKGLRADVDENTRITKEMHADTKEIVEFFRSVKGAFKVLEWIGQLAKPLGAIAALAAAAVGFWTALKGGPK